MEQQWGDPSHHEEEDSEDSDNPAAETWYYKEEPVAQNSEAWEQTLAHGASSSVDKESQKDTEATRNHYLQISPDTSHCMEVVFSTVRKIYGRLPGDPVEDLNVNLAIWRMFMNSTVRAAVHLGRHEFKICTELSLEDNGTAFQRNRKADQWSDRNHWHKPDQFPRFEVGVDKLIAQSSLSIFHCQSLCLLRLFALFGENGRQSC